MNLKEKSLIVYELNEVPKKVIDYYITKRPKSNLSYLCKTGLFKETFTNDSGELHPWSTWPSVHRGVNNDIHCINFLNQDKSCSKLYPPIWEVLERYGISIGIFGSLQTFPPYMNPCVDFFVPDTFAPETTSFPPELELFQKFNLSMARSHKAFAGKIKIIDIINLLNLIKKGLISTSTIIEVLIHLCKEIYDSRYKKRRSNIQAIFAFDAYKKFLNKCNPKYSTFFSNHVAASMHRYWLHTFPKDFGLMTQKKVKDKKFNSLNIIKSMDIADKQIGYLMKFQELRGGSLWIVSGFGQEAITRQECNYEIYLDNEEKFLEAMGLSKSNYKFIPSMYPDINIKCKNMDKLILLLEKVKNLKDENGSKIIRQRYRNKGNTLNLVIEGDNFIDIGKCLFINNKPFKLDEIGFKLITRDIGTGYHTKEGIFISNKNFFSTINKKYLKNQNQIDICNLFDMTLNYFEIKYRKN
tara:strand:+ start:243 stop:1646 length:1404 start_codon:yes stop_codon:yes gene_type:complete